MERARGKKEGDARTYRYDLFVNPSCRHCKRLMQAIKGKGLLMSSVNVIDAVASKREGKLPQWLNRVPTILDHGDVVVAKGKKAARTEPMVYSGSSAFEFVQSWVGDTPQGMVSKKLRNMARYTMTSGGASAFVSPYSVSDRSFGDFSGDPIAVNRPAGTDAASLRKQVDAMAKRQAEQAKGRVRQQ